MLGFGLESLMMVVIFDGFGGGGAKSWGGGVGGAGCVQRTCARAHSERIK